MWTNVDAPDDGGDEEEAACMSLGLQKDGLIKMLVGPLNWFKCETCDEYFKSPVRRRELKEEDVVVCEECFINMYYEFELDRRREERAGEKDRRGGDKPGPVEAVDRDPFS